MRNLNKLNREGLLHKIEKIQRKIESKKNASEHFISTRLKKVQTKWNDICATGETPPKDLRLQLDSFEAMLFTWELEIFLMEEQIKPIKTMLINNEVTEF